MDIKAVHEKQADTSLRSHVSYILAFQIVDNSCGNGDDIRDGWPRLTISSLVLIIDDQHANKD